MPASATRTLLVLTALAESEEPLSAGRLSELTGIARATIGRLLSSLQIDDAVRVDDAGRYAPTTRILRPGFALLRQMRVRDVGFQLLVDLSRAVGYEVFLGLYEFPEIVFVESIFAIDSSVSSRLAYSTKPLLASHTGRLLLSFHPQEALDRLLNEQGAQLGYGDVRAEELRAERRVLLRERFTCFDRTDDGAPAGLGVPILGTDETPVASITIIRQRGLDDEFVNGVLPRALDTARRISAALGSRHVGSIVNI